MTSDVSGSMCECCKDECCKELSSSESAEPPSLGLTL